MKLKHLKAIVDTCVQTMDEETPIVLVYSVLGGEVIKYLEKKKREMRPSDIQIVDGRIRIG